MAELNLLLENKKELISHLNDILTESILLECQKIYDQTRKELSMNDSNAKLLKKYQEQLTLIPEWSKQEKNLLYVNIVKRTGISYLGELIKAIIVNQIKIIIKTENPSLEIPKIKFYIPSAENFVHMCLITVARVIWKQTYLMYHNVRSVERQHNMSQLEGLIHTSMHTVIRTYIPLDVLFKYIKENTASNIEQESDEEITIEEEDDGEEIEIDEGEEDEEDEEDEDEDETELDDDDEVEEDDDDEVEEDDDDEVEDDDEVDNEDEDEENEEDDENVEDDEEEDEDDEEEDEEDDEEEDDEEEDEDDDDELENEDEDDENVEDDEEEDEEDDEEEEDENEEDEDDEDKVDDKVNEDIEETIEIDKEVMNKEVQNIEEDKIVSLPMMEIVPEPEVIQENIEALPIDEESDENKSLEELEKNLEEKLQIQPLQIKPLGIRNILKQPSVVAKKTDAFF
jgi:hypothetical protein